MHLLNLNRREGPRSHRVTHNSTQRRRLRVHAYVLAADPTWLATSVRAYYPHVEKLVVSYDQDGIGWAGGPVRVEACLAALRLLDDDAKIEWAGGRFHSFDRAGGDGGTLGRETRQRRAALELASSGADLGSPHRH